MAHLYKKVKKGREYFYIRETQRVYGKPTTVNQVYLGTAEKVQSLLSGEGQKAQEGFSPKEFGSLFLFNEIDRPVDLAGLVDELLPPKKRTRGPKLGELFFYAALNRAIDPKSKRRLASWYEATDIQRIRPVRLESLNSQNFWNHWDRVKEGDLNKILTRFFSRIHTLLPPQKGDLLLEFSSYTSSSPAPAEPSPVGGRRGTKTPHQFWLALMTERVTGIPVYYQIITDGRQVAGFLEEVVNELLAKATSMGIEVKSLTIVFNKGVDAQELIDLIDNRKELHFLAAYPPDFLPELAAVPLEEFSPLSCNYNRRLLEEGAEQDRVRQYVTRADIHGRPRKVVVCFDPRAFEKQYREFQEKIQRVRQEFVSVQRKLHLGDWPESDPQSLKDYLLRICRYLQLSQDLFQMEVKEGDAAPLISLQLREEEVANTLQRLGKMVLVTDREDWGDREICESYFDRCIPGENGQVNGQTLKDLLLPQYHWTESKLRVNIFVCLVAVTYLVLLCRRLADSGLLLTPKEAMQELRALHTAVFWHPDEEKLKRKLASPSETQLTILHALGYRVEEGKMIPLK
jgi:transposase